MTKKFLDVVDGKTPEEIIAIGKEIYQERKAAGFKGYEEYSSWEEMIAKFARKEWIRIIRKGKSKELRIKIKPMMFYTSSKIKELSER